MLRRTRFLFSEINKFPLSGFKLSEARLAALQKMGVSELFEVQAKTFEPISQGKDVVVRAHTGSGKTLGFAIPVVDQIASTRTDRRNPNPSCIAMAPTRELAKQVASAFVDVAPDLKVVCVYGGAPINPQVNEIRQGVDILVATPGRVHDLIDRGYVSLTGITHVILDEADELMRVGFKEEVDRILAHAPESRQTLLFSATLPPWVKSVCRNHLKNPETIDLLQTTRQTTRNVKHLAIEVGGGKLGKDRIIGDLLSFYSTEKCIVFTSTKRTADELVAGDAIRTDCQVLHGDIAQSTRESTMKAFREGRFPVLVATDVAARGLDVPEIDLVVQYDFPNDSEGYVHRSGRTGRAGREGTAIVLFHPNERMQLKDLEQKIGTNFDRTRPPAPQVIAEKVGESSMTQVESVSPATIAVFRKQADMLLAGDKDPTDVIAAALAVVSGFKDGVSQRSLLTMETGKQTLMLKGEFSSVGSFLMKASDLVPRAAGKIGNVQWCADGQAVVFDVSPEMAAEFIELEDVTSLDTLPALREQVSRFGRTGGFGSQQGGGRFGSRSAQGGGGFGSSRGRDFGSSRGRDFGSSRGRDFGSRPQSGGFQRSGGRDSMRKGTGWDQVGTSSYGALNPSDFGLNPDSFKQSFTS